ncbi:MAG: LemA family protein [Candidatus Brocadiaceae bacterium]|mgnify:CR=1 FL=1|nr:LemA family protein [Candidatus Brocadiaceae bacterium]
MTGGVIALIVVGGLLVLVVLWAIGTYNGLIRLRNQVENAWAQIDVQLKRRHDLIPNLIETAKGYMTHERGTLEAVVKARNLAAQAAGPGEASQAEQGLNGALSQFFVVVERYPDLKANQNFLALQEELASTENKIGFARQFYNDQTMQYNIRIQSFPANILAGMFNFARKDLFELESEAERAVPKVQF